MRRLQQSNWFQPKKVIHLIQESEVVINAKNLDYAISSVVQIYTEGLAEGDVDDVLDPRNVGMGNWSGSGVFIRVNGEDGYILTNAHVVKNGLSFKIRTVLTSEETFEVKLMGMIETLDPDIALLKMDAEELARIKEMIESIPFLELESEDNVKRGMAIKAIGYPMGMDEPNVSSGEVTNFVSGSELESERIVTDAAINPGNSGGPSINENGKIIGLNTSIILGANNIGFITPVSFVKIVLQNLLDGKETNLSFLGGRFQKNSKENSEYLNSPIHTGVILTTIYPKGLLEKAGLKPRDILLKINEFEFDRHGVVKTEEFSRHTNIYDVVRLIPLNSIVTLEYVRNGQKLIAKQAAVPRTGLNLKTTNNLLHRKYVSFEGMIIQELNFLIIQALAEISPEKYDRFIELLARDKRKLAITFVSMNSLANNIGIDFGDVISSVNGNDVNELEDLVKKLNELTDKKEKIIMNFESGAFGVFENIKTVKVQTPLDHIEV